MSNRQSAHEQKMRSGGFAIVQSKQRGGYNKNKNNSKQIDAAKQKLAMLDHVDDFSVEKLLTKLHTMQYVLLTCCHSQWVALLLL